MQYGRWFGAALVVALACTTGCKKNSDDAPAASDEAANEPSQEDKAVAAADTAPAPKEEQEAASKADPPKEDQKEEQGAAPYADAYFHTGHWAWLGRRWVWEKGYWGHRYATVAPPRVRYERHGLAPSGHHYWIGGNWHWDGARYGWRGGYWGVHRAGHTWVPSRWHHVEHTRWEHHAGHWR